MSQTGPWSVKGIDNKAREAAREAAREEGTTLGAYLNRLILQDDPDAAGQPAPRPSAQASFAQNDPVADLTNRSQASYDPQPSRRAPADEPSNAALDRLTRRIESAEARSTLAITGIDQSVVGLLSRLENAEHNQQALGNHWDTVLGDVQKTYEVINSKITSIENDNAPKRNQAALQALEEALGKLASHVYEENELVSEESTAIKMRLESGLGELTSRMDNVDESVERRLQEASETVTKAVADSQMRVEGTNRHLAERFSQLEVGLHNELSAANSASETLGQSLAEQQQHIGTLQDQLNRTEASLQDELTAANSTTETLGQSLTEQQESISAIQDRLNRAEAATNDALEHLKSTFSNLDDRLEDISGTTSSEIAGVAEDIRQQFDSKFDTLADDMRSLIASTRAEMASEIEVAARSVDSELIARLEDTISAMGARLDASEDMQAQTMEMVGDTVTRITESVDQRLVAGQNQQSRDIEQIGAQVTRVSESIDQRFSEINLDDQVAAATSELRDDMVRFTNSMDARFEQIESMDTGSVDRIASEVEQLADKLDARVQESEQRSASAIEQVGEQVAGVAERLEHRQAQALQEFSEKLDAHTQTHEARLSSALSNVSDRLERIQEQSITTISPVQQAIATLAQRIEAIEDFSAPPYIERNGTPDVPAMVSPVKINTAIEAPADKADLTDAQSVSASLAATAEPQADFGVETAPADSEPFEAGYKNWSTSPVDLLDETEQDTAATNEAEKVHDYFAELPPPMDTDQSIFNASNEARDSDIFEEEAEPAPVNDIEADKVEAFDAVANPYAEELTTPEADAPTAAPENDFLAQARNAARSAAATSTPAQRPSKSRPPKSEKKSGSNGRVLVAGIGLLAVAGSAGYMVMNKDSAPEAVNLTDRAPVIPTNTAAAAVPAALPEAAPASAEQTSAQEAATPSQLMESEFSEASSATTSEAEAPAIAQTVAPAAAAPAPAPIEARAEKPARLSALTVPTISPVPSLSEAASSGNAIAQYTLGAQKIADGNITTGIALLRSAEAQGLAIAQYELGNHYISGIGVEKDPNRAIPLFKAAAEAGNVGAMHNYATLIAGTPGREAEAANWYQRAAELGLVEAQFNIATMYESGDGVSPSLHRALFWYELAAASGDTDAASAVADLSGSDSVSAVAVSRVKEEVAAWSATQRDIAANGQFAPNAWARASREQILGIQKALNALDYDAGTPDGAMGATTRAAIKAFQSDTGLSASGRIDNALIDTLNDAAKRARTGL